MARRPAARDHHMIGDAALAGERDGNGFLGLILVELVEDQRVERVHAVFCGCGAGRGILVGGYQAGPFLSEIPRRERVIGSRGARPSRRSNQRGSACRIAVADRSEEHTSELQSLMRTSYAVLFLQKKTSSNHYN